MGPRRINLPVIRPARTDLRQRHHNALVILLQTSPMIRLQQRLPVII